MEIINLVLAGFAAGLGNGLSYWLIIKRLNRLEKIIRGKKDGIQKRKMA